MLEMSFPNHITAFKKRKKCLAAALAMGVVEHAQKCYMGLTRRVRLDPMEFIASVFIQQSCLYIVYPIFHT